MAKKKDDIILRIIGLILLSPVLLIILGILLLVGVYFGVIDGVSIHGDDEVDLGNGWVWFNFNIHKKLANGYSDSLCIPDNKSTDRVWNDRYIEVYQDINANTYLYPDTTLWADNKEMQAYYKSPNGKADYKKQVADYYYYQELVRQKKLFYLVDKQKDSIYGPMTKARLYHLEDSLHTGLHLER